jgi:hypothetical protein
LKIKLRTNEDDKPKRARIVPAEKDRYQKSKTKQPSVVEDQSIVQNSLF